jgi:tocopherol cyclase
MGLLMVFMANIWRPEAFQGKGKKKDYFEGWYFKSVDKAETSAIVIIPGISLSPDPSRSHAFIMVIDARAHAMHYFTFPVSDFSADRKKFEVSIGKNFFSLHDLRLDLRDGSTDIKAVLRFKDIRPWPVRLLSPGVMGWYRFVPLMECYHGVLSFDHHIEGYLSINGEKRDLSGGKGYIEKDWGASMPSSWIWMQTNHFDVEGISLSGSIARIPWLRSHFTGYIFGLLYQGHLYQFTTYGGAKVKRLQVSPGKIEIALEDHSHYLEITADRREGVDIPAPSLGEMTAKVNEALDSRIDIRLYGKKNGGMDLIFSGTGRNAGLEFVGDVDELVNGLKK